MSKGPPQWLVSTDQMGNKVELTEPPQRIISLVPSQTELLFDLGLEDRVIGITKFCVHPAHWRKSKTIIGGTKNFQLERIVQLRPDLVIGNKEENYPEGIATLQQHFPLWMSDIVLFEDAISMISSISILTGCQERGVEIIKGIQNAFEHLKLMPKTRTLYLMWRKPWMGAGGRTFIHSMMQKIGLVNVLDKEERYPELSTGRIKDLNPSLILLSTEPFSFSEKHTEEVLAIIPGARVVLVDGEMFSWYGSRMALAPAYINSMKIGA